MDNTLIAGFIGAASALAAALFTISYQYWQYNRQLELSRLADIVNEKKKIIGDLISYRFILTDRKNHAIPVTAFNAALSRVPVMFSENKLCMDRYRSFGKNFNSEKFYELITALMDDVPLNRDYIDRHLLENVPAAQPMTGT